MTYQATKKTDFTVDLIWWGLLRLAPIIIRLQYISYQLPLLAVAVYKGFKVYFMAKLNAQSIMSCEPSQYIVFRLIVTGFTTTVPIGTRNEIQFIADY